jgi:hypothetical protein
MALNKVIFFVASIFFIAMGMPETALARNTNNVVEVCNKGDVDISYIVFASKSSFLGGEEAKISGWHKIKRGKCNDVNPRGFQGVTIGFLQKNRDGIVGNPVYNIRNAGKAGSTKRAPSVICAPINDTVDYKSSLGVVRDKYLPPCGEGFAEFKMSFYDKPNDIFPTFNLKPRSSDRLSPWPNAAASLASPSQDNKRDQVNAAVIIGKTVLGAAKGLEDAKVRKLSPACTKSVLTFAFAFTEEGPAKACGCVSRKIIRGENPDVVSSIVSDIDAGRDFDDATEKITEENFTKYLESCTSSPSSASSSSQNGAGTSGDAADAHSQALSEPELTLEQQAAALFPDPVKPSYGGGAEYDNSEPTRNIQQFMKRWEELTGKNFLTDHWSMKPRQGRNSNGVLTEATAGYGQWPNIYAAYNAAEATILNNYKIQWHRVATTEEMRQCVRPPVPERPRACGDPNKSFMMPECFQTSNWREPDWCRAGYDPNPHITTIAKTEHGGLASYGNIVGDCLVKADADGSSFIETRNNGKEIRGFFYKDDLLKNAYVSVECGQVWRDFATAVYNADTDQAFVAANPMSVIIATTNAQAVRDMAAYNAQAAQVQLQRENWVTQQ